MPLSEHEQRLLDQMEQALYNEDPKFVSRLAEDPQRTRHRKKLVLGALGLIVGLGVVVLAVATQQIWLGGIGFAIMVAGGAYALTPSRSTSSSSSSDSHLGSVQDNGSVRAHRPSDRRRKTRPGADQRGSTRGPSRRPAASSGTFMERMEQRWEKRRRQGGGR